jgi:hypothetical protein
VTSPESPAHGCHSRRAMCAMQVQWCIGEKFPRQIMEIGRVCAFVESHINHDHIMLSVIDGDGS